jgi:tRNA A-37 threonylcarbamoyl transferase component Bud32
MIQKMDTKMEMGHTITMSRMIHSRAKQGLAVPMLVFVKKSVVALVVVQRRSTDVAGLDMKNVVLRLCIALVR